MAESLKEELKAGYEEAQAAGFRVGFLRGMTYMASRFSSDAFGDEDRAAMEEALSEWRAMSNRLNERT